MQQLSMRGLIARQKPKGLDPAELGPLASVSDAQRWLHKIAAGLVSGRLADKAGTAAIRALEAWLSAEKDRVQADDLASLRQQLADVREALKTGRRLEVVS